MRQKKYFIPLVVPLVTVVLFFFSWPASEIIYPNNQDYKIDSYSDEDQGGTTQIKIINDSILSVYINHGLAYEYPFAGIYFQPAQEQLVDLNNGNSLLLNLHCKDAQTVYVVIEEFLPEQDLSIPFEINLKADPSKTAYVLKLSDFIIPSWWLETHADFSSRNLKSDHVLSINIESRYVLEEPLERQFDVEKVVISKNIPWWILVFAPLGLLGLIRKKSVQVSAVPLEVIQEHPMIYFMQEHISNSELSIEKLAQHFHLDKSEIDQKIQEKTGQNFKQTLARLRIEKAKKLLKESDEKVFEIARLCGYNNASAFTQAFKSATGKTPNSYRKR